MPSSPNTRISSQVRRPSSMQVTCHSSSSKRSSMKPPASARVGHGQPLQPARPRARERRHKQRHAQRQRQAHWPGAHHRDREFGIHRRIIRRTRRWPAPIAKEQPMALMDFIKKQFIDVLQWTEEGDGVLAWRFPMAEMEIQNGASLTVRESQLAVFVNEGQVADVFGPGTYKLTTQTLPVLTYLKNWDKLFESPFKSDVYFFSTRQQVDQRWGTQQPVTIRDKDFGAVRLRAFGIFSARVTQPLLFVNTLVGTQGAYGSDQVEAYLREVIVSRLNDFLGEHLETVYQLPRQYDEIGVAVKTRLRDDFRRYGLELIDFFVNAITPPPDVQQMIDEDRRAAADVVHDVPDPDPHGHLHQAAPHDLPGQGEDLGALALLGAILSEAHEKFNRLF